MFVLCACLFVCVCFLRVCCVDVFRCCLFPGLLLYTSMYVRVGVCCCLVMCLNAGVCLLFCLMLFVRVLLDFIVWLFVCVLCSIVFFCLRV